MKSVKFVTRIASLFLPIALVACGGSEDTQSSVVAEFKQCLPPAAGESWPTALPDEVGLNAEQLDAAVDEAMSRQSGTFQVFRFGCLVASDDIGVLADVERNMWSHTKTVVSLVVGRAIQLGKMEITDTVADYFPEADAAHGAITLQQLLTMSSGLNMNWPTELNVAESDRVQVALNLPFEHDPGTWFEYAQTTPTVITAMVERAVKMDFQAFAHEELFIPIGIERDSWFWLRDRAGNTEGYAWWFSLPNDNLARLGTLMLQGGRWDGEQLLDADYMRQLRTPSVANPGYGYLTWLNAGETYVSTGFNARTEHPRRIIPSAPTDLYTSAGFHGQVSTVIPSLDMVITRTQNILDLGGPDQTLDTYIAGTDFGEGYYEIIRSLMKAVEDLDYVDPGEWNEPADYNVDLGQQINDPLVPLATIGIGPYAPDGCNIVVCNGGLAHEGTIQSVMDILNYAGPQ